MLMALEFGTVDGDALAQNVVAAILYFIVGIAVLGAGFLMVDLLTPGSLRHLVFVERRPNAVAVASGDVRRAGAGHRHGHHRQFRANSGRAWSTRWSTAWSGWCCRAWRWWCWKSLVPGRFRDLIAAEKLHPAAIATAVILLCVGGVNAAALS